ncbi:hypothetical protein HJC06_04165 [Rhizobium sp. NLR9b]|uniref:hypothetical protein n=1 Tax=unclassified Rhizobium TaxID=2613769 RepID=UPI001C82CBE1|nr:MULTISPECIES: hypothetical protein [unclassified Rhizobium]MBX5225634.1 hypothetical protein [Rhizobium sp. NLR9b]MBX5286307.1 hypothetical protein [Rhizobium sp. NLR10b]
MRSLHSLTRFAAGHSKRWFQIFMDVVAPEPPSSQSSIRIRDLRVSPARRSPSPGAWIKPNKALAEISCMGWRKAVSLLFEQELQTKREGPHNGKKHDLPMVQQRR